MFAYTLPSGREVIIREMTGVEEEILTNQRLQREGTAINQVLLNCLTRLDENDSPGMNDIMDMLSGDRQALLVKLREISLGDVVDLELTCPQCGTTNYISVDLTKLPVTQYTEDREFTFQLPRSEKQVRFRLMDGHMEKRMASLKKPTLTDSMMMRIIDIDEKPPNKKTLAQMSLFDRQALRKEMARVDAGIDTLVQITCDNCSVRLSTRLEGEPHFLFPDPAT